MINLCCRLVGLVLLVVGATESVHEQITFSSIISKILQESRRDVLISPHMLKDSLWQLFLGAEGKTQREILNVFNVKHATKEEAVQELSQRQQLFQGQPMEAPDGKPGPIMGNGLYLEGEKNIIPKYKDQISDIFGTEVRPINTQHWKGFLSQMSEALKYVGYPEGIIDDETNVLLLSEIYFYTSFDSAFQKIIRGSFHNSENTMEIAKVAQIGNFKYVYIDKVAADVLELPLKDSKIVILILIPRALNGLDKLMENLDILEIQAIIPPAPSKELAVIHPIFDFNFIISLKSILQRLGIQNLLKDVDLGSMTDWKAGKLFCDFVSIARLNVHDDNINMSEPLPSDFPNPKSLPVVDINHPFVYVVKDEHNVLFTGRVNNPKIYIQNI